MLIEDPQIFIGDPVCVWDGVSHDFLWIFNENLESPIKSEISNKNLGSPMKKLGSSMKKGVNSTKVANGKKVSKYTFNMEYNT